MWHHNLLDTIEYEQVHHFFHNSTKIPIGKRYGEVKFTMDVLSYKAILLVNIFVKGNAIVFENYGMGELPRGGILQN